MSQQQLLGGRAERLVGGGGERGRRLGFGGRGARDGMVVRFLAPCHPFVQQIEGAEGFDLDVLSSGGGGGVASPTALFEGEGGFEGVFVVVDGVLTYPGEEEGDPVVALTCQGR